MRTNKRNNFGLEYDEDGLSKREKDFCLFYLASQGKKPKWACGKAGYSGDLAKRSRSLLDRPQVQEFLERYAPPVNKFAVKSDPKSIVRRLEQIASAEGVDKTVMAQLKAIEFLMRNQGMLDGTSSSGKDRLGELVEVFKAGAVEKGSQPCAKCKTMTSPSAKFCSQCGAFIEREQTPAEKLVAVKKKVGKAEVIQ